MTVQGTWPLAHDQSARPLRFEKTFTLPPSWPKITSARLYITSHGVYEAYINSKKVGNHCLSPGFQSYNKRLHYQTYDVTEHLSQMKENIIQVEVGPGWFASAISWAKKRFIYGEKLGVMAQLEIQTKDSPETLTIFTDESWNASLSEIISSEIYDGELFDRRLLTEGTPSQ